MFALLAGSLLDYSIAAWRKEPAFQIEDAYKWLFHATLGGEHAVHSLDEAQSWIDDEWKGLGKPLPHEPVTVSLRPDGKLLRVNLRPYKAAGGSKDALLAIFVKSAKQFRADKSRFISIWRELGARLHSGPIGRLTEDAWLRLDRETRPGYPAIEHSNAYIKAAKPAYRVVEQDYWTALRRRSPVRRKRLSQRSLLVLTRANPIARAPACQRPLQTVRPEQPLLA